MIVNVNSICRDTIDNTFWMKPYLMLSDLNMLVGSKLKLLKFDF